jgi:hypothetical protein
MLKAHYAEAFGQHLLSTQQVRTLQAAADKALDEAGQGLSDWQLLRPSCHLRGLPGLLRRWKVRGVWRAGVSGPLRGCAWQHCRHHVHAPLHTH